jgi:hypothetical protein
MTKYTVLILLLLKTFTIYAQNPKIIEITELSELSKSDLLMRTCKDPKYGIIVVNTDIADLEFKILNAGKNLINQTRQQDERRYILCVEPMYETFDVYNIQITSNNIITKSFSVHKIQSGNIRSYAISEKPLSNTVEITVFDKDGNPLSNTKVGIKGKDYEVYTDSKGVYKLELPSANLETLVISHNLYSDTKEVIVRPGDKQTVRLYRLKPPETRKFRKPLIEDWTKDFKMIFGLSNGIVAGETVGLYGELKFGDKTGFAIEGGYGMGIGENDYERWSAGVKGYYNYLFLSTHYGTTMNVFNRNAAFTMNDDGTFILPGSRAEGRKGVTLLSGYDRTFGWFHLTAGIGGTVTTTVNPKFLFAWNVGIGVSLIDLLNK